jgi:hypothetical protein
MDKFMNSINPDSNRFRRWCRSGSDNAGEGEWLWTANAEQMSILRSRHADRSGSTGELEFDNQPTHRDLLLDRRRINAGNKYPAPIIDAHCHLTPGDKFMHFSRSHWRLRKYLKQAKSGGICFSIIFPPPGNNYHLLNRKTLILGKRYPLRFGGCILIQPARDRDRVNRIVGAYERHFPLYGLKVHRHDGNISDEICTTARRYRLPIIYDIMEEVGDIDRLGESYPDVSFIIPHLGSFADRWHIQEKAIRRMRRYPNLYTDTSGVRRLDLLRMALYVLGVRNVLFGTDAPYLHPIVELSKLINMGLTRQVFASIAGKNAIRLFRIIDHVRCTTGSANR